MQKALFVALMLLPIQMGFARNAPRQETIYGYNQTKKDFLRAQKKRLSKPEQEALRLLCEIGFKSGSSDAWKNNDINAAIASIAWGKNWPETANTTAYKTCNFPNYGGKPSYPAFLRDIELIKLKKGQCILANVSSVDARFGAIQGEFGSENGRVNLTNNFSLYLFRNLQDKNGNWRMHERSNPISFLDAKRMFRRNDPIALCLKFQSQECKTNSKDRIGNIYSITNRRTKEKRFAQIGLNGCKQN